MEHDINLNIHYSAPDDIWEKIGEVYASMPYWSGNENGPHWEGNDIDIWASVEPSGIQIAGTMLLSRTLFQMISANYFSQNPLS